MKKNTDIACIRCGACCQVDMFAYISSEDIVRWEKEQRLDIIARMQDNGLVWSGDRIIDNSGKKLDGCIYLKFDGSSSFCEIYETRPIVCRDFIPGSSEICPQYYRKA